MPTGNFLQCSIAKAEKKTKLSTGLRNEESARVRASERANKRKKDTMQYSDLKGNNLYQCASLPTIYTCCGTHLRRDDYYLKFITFSKTVLVAHCKISVVELPLNKTTSVHTHFICFVFVAVPILVNFLARSLAFFYLFFL